MPEKPSHTPGPWKVETEKWEYYLKTGKLYSVTAPNQLGQLVAQITGEGTQPKANAALIAVSSEMQETLEKLSENIAVWYSECDAVCTRDMKWWIGEIDGLLAKAKGESHA